MGIVWLTNCFLYFFQEKGHANIDKISLWGENMAKKDKNKGEKKTLRKAQEITYNREFKRADRAALSDD